MYKARKSTIASLALALMCGCVQSAFAQTFSISENMVKHLHRSHATRVLPSPISSEVVGKTSPRQAPRHIDEAASAPEFYGAVVYGDEWSQDQYGLYSFKAEFPLTLQSVALDPELVSSYGGVLVGDRYYCTVIDLQGTTINNIRFNTFDANTWKLLKSVPMDDPSTMATDVTYDPTTKTVYGCFYNDNASGYVWGKLDVAAGRRTIVRSLPSSESLYVVACNAQGEMYGVRQDGNVVSIDKQTGRQTVIGASGVLPRYMQSGEFDRVSGQLYWATSLDSGGSTFCTIDTSTGKAQFIDILPDNAEITVLCQPNAADNADSPNTVTFTLNLGSNPNNVNLVGVMPKVTMGGGNLTGSLSYAYLMDGVKIGEGNAQPGAEVKCSVSAETGYHTFKAYASNAAGRGQCAEIRQWVGWDMPTAVIAPKATPSDNSVLVSWTAPTRGAHNGTLNGSELRYSVTRMPDAKIVATAVSTTSVTDIIANDDPIDDYYYVITPATSAGEGEPAVTATVRVGHVLTGPAAVSDFVATPAAKGALSATLTFTAPTLFTDRTPLSSISRIDVKRGTTLVKSFDNPAPGAALSCSDDGIGMVRGMQTWNVIAYAGKAPGDVATASAFCGPDAPGMPRNVRMKLGDDGFPVITWEDPTESKNGGYFNPYLCYYVVMRVPDAATLTENCHDISYVDHSIDTEKCDQMQLYYAVWVGNEYGESGPATSNGLIVGRPYTMPYSESFEGALAHTIWALRTFKGEGQWIYTYKDAQDGDGGAVRFAPKAAGDEQRMYSGRIAVGSAKSPTLNFYYRGKRTAKGDRVFVEVAKDDGDFETVETIDFASKDGWTRAQVDLTPYAVGAKWIQVAFRAVSNTGREDLYIDNVTVENMVDHDLCITAFEGVASTSVEKSVTMSVAIENRGAEDADGYRVVLYADGEEVAACDGSPLACKGGKTKCDLSFVPTVWSAAEVELLAVVEYEPDMDESNNSAVRTIYVEQNSLPAVDDLAASASPQSGGVGGAGSVLLTWSAPSLDAEVYALTEEGAEHMTPFVPVNEHGWSSYDLDGQTSYGIGDYVYPGKNQPLGFQAFNPEEVGLDMPKEPDLVPHGGEQYFVAFDTKTGVQSDDWLVSPLLSGRAQTIRFFARSKGQYGGVLEQFEIMISASGNDPSDFRTLEESYQIAPTKWTEYTYQLPEGTRYFAIRNITTDVYILMVDDITCEISSKAPADCILESYELYRNGQLLVQLPATATSYSDATATSGSERYAIVARYNYGPSPLSNIASLSTVGIAPLSSELSPLPSYDLQGRKQTRPSRDAIIVGQGRKQVVR